MSEAFAQTTANEAPITRAYEPPSFNDGPVLPSLMARSTDAPPADVVGTVQALTQSCVDWGAGRSGPTSDGLPPTESLTLHRDICTALTEPQVFYGKMDDAFGMGVMFTIGAIIACVVFLRTVRYAVRKWRGERKAEVPAQVPVENPGPLWLKEKDKVEEGRTHAAE